MKLSLSKLLAFFSYGDRLKPTRDWFVLLAVAASIFVVSVVWNIFLFTDIQNGKSVGGAATVNRAATTTPITAVQDVFKKRATQESNYQHAYTFIDPSLGGR